MDTKCFFKYEIEDVSTLDSLVFLLNVTDRTKLQVYLHDKPEPGPSLPDHSFPLGDAPYAVLEAFFVPSIKLSLFEDTFPFVYDEVSNTVKHVATLDTVG